MGCRVIDDGDGQACFYDSVSMTAFGPVMPDEEHANAFMDWLAEPPRCSEDTVAGRGDPRGIPTVRLVELHAAFAAEKCCAKCGELLDFEVFEGGVCDHCAYLGHVGKKEKRR